MWDQSNVMKESKHHTRLMIRSETAQANILLQRTPVKQKPQIIMALDQKFKEQKCLWTLKGGFGDVNKRPGSTCCPTGVPSLDFIPSTSNLWICQILAHMVAFFWPCGQNVAVVSLPWWENIRWMNNSPEAEQKIQLAAGKIRTLKKPSVGHFNTHACTQRSQHGEC